MTLAEPFRRPLPPVSLPLAINLAVIPIFGIVWRVADRLDSEPLRFVAQGGLLLYALPASFLLHGGLEGIGSVMFEPRGMIEAVLLNALLIGAFDAARRARRSSRKRAR